MLQGSANLKLATDRESSGLSFLARIRNDQELMNKHHKGDGYIYNDFGDSTNWNPEDFNKLHRASCRWVRKMNTNFPKYYFRTLDEATDWLDTHRPGCHSFCGSCMKKRSQILF